ncbi:methyltransferase domain-containing protein [Pectobacterium versatile]|uniref:methyltransferase domain-containing protein n=1 Tax=Pectobacterium versatile TaxID=2488639 RepID=UPI003018BCBF
MSKNNINVVIMQDVGNMSSLGFVDAALFYKYQFETLGRIVTLTKNRLVFDAINIVFGSNDVIPPEWNKYCCIFVNLEQLTDGGFHASDAYKNLIKEADFIDYSMLNINKLQSKEFRKSIYYVPFGYAPYLESELQPIENREIDVLFIGIMNEKRKRIIQIIESSGISVSTFDSPLYGPEKDYFIRNSKCVFNCHYYDSSLFEEVRAFNVLSLGTPLISLLEENEVIPEQYKESVTFIKESDILNFFNDFFKKPSFYKDSYSQLNFFKTVDVSQYYREVINLGDAVMNKKRVTGIAEGIKKIHIGSGKDYKSGWINIDILKNSLPDIILDLSQVQTFPIMKKSPFYGDVTLKEGCYDFIYANNVLEYVTDPVTMMTNCLALLRTGGKFFIEVPYEKSNTAWQTPTHVREMNANSLIYYTEWFWYLGWFEYKFKLSESCYLNINLSPCEESNAVFMRVVLEKTSTTFQEKCLARTMLADIGGLGTVFDY